MTFRWSEEALAAFDKRRREWESKGKVRTHRIDKPDEPELPPTPRVSKYGNVKAEAGGMLFASKRERSRWIDLRLQEKAGAITKLQRQVVYPIVVNDFKVCDYIADFVYERSGALMVEDAKGYRTEVYLLKKKLMRAVHGVEILET
jgi:hypothetical protein